MGVGLGMNLAPTSQDMLDKWRRDAGFAPKVDPKVSSHKNKSNNSKTKGSDSNSTSNNVSKNTTDRRAVESKQNRASENVSQDKRPSGGKRIRKPLLSLGEAQGPTIL